VIAVLGYDRHGLSSLTPQQAAEERSVFVAIVLDVAISAVFTVTGLLAAR